MNRLGGTQKDTNPLRLNIAQVHVPLSAVLAAWTMRKVGSGFGWLLRHSAGCCSRSLGCGSGSGCSTVTASS